MLEYFILINFITWILFGLDKLFAIRHQFRIPERALLTLLILGGCVGGLLGMLTFSHKYRKKLFRIIVFLSTVLWITIFIGIYL